MDTHKTTIINSGQSKKRILFLGYTAEQTSLIDYLINAKHDVCHSQEKNFMTEGFDLIISFGYRYLIKKSLISRLGVPLINLHISYLPWNRGAHPNFWSFFDSTPSGVSIHLIDEGIDTGPILYQKYVNFDISKLTFEQTFNHLKVEVESLFKENLQNILIGNYKPIPQRRYGSYHRLADLPTMFAGWNANILDEILRLDKIMLNKD